MDVMSLLLSFAKQRHFPEDLYHAVDEAAGGLLKRNQAKVLQTMKLGVTAYAIFGVQESRLVPLCAEMLAEAAE